MKNTQFVACLDKSKIAVEHIYTYLINRGYDIDDLQDNKDYYKSDIDCRIKKDGNEVMAEIKTDFYKIKKNVCIETISNTKSGRYGWLYKTEADFIIFYLVLFGEIYIISTSDLVNIIKENEENLQKRYTKTTDKSNNELYWGEIILLPISLLLTKAKKYNLFDRKETELGLI